MIKLTVEVKGVEAKPTGTVSLIPIAITGFRLKIKPIVIVVVLVVVVLVGVGGGPGGGHGSR